MDLSAVSMGAASAVTQNFAAMGSAIQAVGQNPTPAGAAALSSAATPDTFAVGVLKQTLATQASTGAQLAQMIGGGSGIDIQA